VLRKFFTNEELEALTPQMNASAPTGLKYYPLPSRGERFPVDDPNKEPVMEPRPQGDAQFLQGAVTTLFVACLPAALPVNTCLPPTKCRPCAFLDPQHGNAMGLYPSITGNH
jgi:hypothetical protein